MNKLSSPALGLTVAVALATGALLLKHQSPRGQAPGAYSDILIVEDDSLRAGEKAPVPTDNPQSSAESQKMTGTNSSAQDSQGDMNKGNPPRAPE